MTKIILQNTFLVQEYIKHTTANTRVRRNRIYRLNSNLRNPKLVIKILTTEDLITQKSYRKTGRVRLPGSGQWMCGGQGTCVRVATAALGLCPSCGRTAA